MDQQFPGSVRAHTVFLLWVSLRPCSDATPWVEQGQLGCGVRWTSIRLAPPDSAAPWLSRFCPGLSFLICVMGATIKSDPKGCGTLKCTAGARRAYALNRVAASE